MIYSSPALIKIRNITRKLGLNKLIGRVLVGKSYEDKFGPTMVQKIQPGECVWDIGANVGLYTAQFAARLNGNGTVIAFEPVPACFKKLQEQTKNKPNISLLNVAVGAEDGEITMMLDNNDLAATHRVITNEVNSKNTKSCSVPVRSAASLAEEYPQWFPNVIKIDVEGYEGQVFEGLRSLLPDHRLRCIGIEVHFGLLEERGEGNCPQTLEKSLTQFGFNVNWTDASHLIAIR